MKNTASNKKSLANSNKYCVRKVTEYWSEYSSNFMAKKWYSYYAFKIDF